MVIYNRFNISLNLLQSSLIAINDLTCNGLKVIPEPIPKSIIWPPKVLAHFMYSSLWVNYNSNIACWYSICYNFFSKCYLPIPGVPNIITLWFVLYWVSLNIFQTNASSLSLVLFPTKRLLPSLSNFLWIC